ncbi:MAG: hypothetical protein AB4058_01690 [Microcystaceae cyanobacterium]
MNISLRTSLSIISLGLITLSSLNIPLLANPVPPSLISQNTKAKSETLTKAEIQTIIDSIEKARKEDDVDGVLKHVAPFIHSRVSVELEKQTIIFELDGLAEHRQYLSETYDFIENRKILDRQVDIRIAQDGQMAVALIYEEVEYITDEGGSILTESVDTLRFGLVNGQPMVVSATLKGWLAPTPSQSRK